MAPEAGPPSGGSVKLGHLALHYRAREDGPLAARLMQILGFAKIQEFPLADGPFYQFEIERGAADDGVGILYLSPVPAPIAVMNRAIHDALNIGRANEHPAAAELREGQKLDPEMCFHVGLMMTSLERIENIVTELRALSESDNELGARLNIMINAARPGDAAIDARMAASPVFAGIHRYPYGRNAIQVFIETDLLMSGPLGENMVIELDYIFPGHAKHLLNSTEA